MVIGKYIQLILFTLLHHLIIFFNSTRFSVYGDWECKRHRVFLPFGQQKEPYDKVMVVLMMMVIMVMMVMMVMMKR